MSASFQDQRIAKRVPYPCEVECTVHGESPLRFRISDLSATGAFLDTLTLFPRGSVLDLHFLLESTDINVRAEVRYAMDQLGMGVRFLDIRPDQQAVIANAVQKRSA